jgi:hypothetical protein
MALTKASTTGDEPVVTTNKPATSEIPKGAEKSDVPGVQSVVSDDGQLAPADKTSIPGPEYPPIDRPPVSTTRPDVPIAQSLITGAGKHMPPDPEKYDEMGRPRD